MRENASSLTNTQLTENWHTWTALHHFLPASLIRELSYIIVKQMSNGKVRLNQLFDETFTNGPESLDSWLVKPLEVESQIERYLQRRIRAFAWHNDPGSFAPPDEESSESHSMTPSKLDKIIELGSIDFGMTVEVLEGFNVSNQPSFKSFLETFKRALTSFRTSNPEEFLLALEPSINSLASPLNSVVAKHIGDLSADADEWEKAEVMYGHAKHLLINRQETTWDVFALLLGNIITQSIAAAKRTIYGSAAAAELLSETLSKADSPLLLANASYDEMVARINSSGEHFPPDRRAALLPPPLIHGSHDVSNALKQYSKGNYSEAHRHFWSVLRRQIALGSATESRETKALYARSLLDEINQSKIRHNQTDNFGMAIRLLIESGDFNLVEQISWDEKGIDAHVDSKCVVDIIAHAQAHPGSKLERNMVVVELFRVWLERLTTEHFEVAKMMLSHIAEQVSKGPTSFFKSQNLRAHSIKTLTSTGKSRPELRHVISTEVADIISSSIQKIENWTDIESLLETALVYIDEVPIDSTRSIVKSTLSLLDRTSPESGMWTVVRPALNLLVSEPVKCLAGQELELGQQIITTILRFGLEQQSEHANVLFYLNNFAPELLRDISVQGNLQDAINHVRKQAKEINSSNVVANIQALLIAPAASGREGVEDALKGLTSILQSVTETRQSLSVSFAYNPLLLLANQQEQIASDISMSSDDFQSLLKPLIPLISNLWFNAKTRPLVFAPFSFPPATKPDSTTIHNWALASIVFAETLGHQKQILHVIELAESNPILADSIALARATRLAEQREASIDIDIIHAKNRDTFYSTLGRNLVILQKLDKHKRQEVCKTLVGQCFRYGPRELDAAVFLSAINMNLGEYVASHSQSGSNYMARLENNRNIQLTIQPILSMLINMDET